MAGPQTTTVLDRLVYIDLATPREDVRDGCPCFYYEGLARIEAALGPQWPIASDGYGSVWVRQTAEYWKFAFAYSDDPVKTDENPA